MKTFQETSLDQKPQGPLLEKGKERQVLIFSVSNQEFGLDLSLIREVLRLKEIYRLPKAPEFIEGVIHLRGHLIALINLRKRLQLPKKDDGSDQKVILCKINRMVFGILVEGFKEIISLPSEAIRPLPPLLLGGLDTKLISGMARIGERVIPILNLGPIVWKKEDSQS